MGSDQAMSPGAGALRGAAGWQGCAASSSPVHCAQDRTTEVYKSNIEAS